MTGMAGMVERQKEWQNGRMAEINTYVLFTVHTDDTDDDDTLIFYSIDEDSSSNSESLKETTKTPTKKNA